MRRGSSWIAACLAAACPASAVGQISAFWQPVTISPQAIAEVPQLATMQTLDLKVTTTGNWAIAGLRAVLPAGLAYYKHPLGGNTRPNSALFGSNPALEFTGYVTAPADNGITGTPSILGGWPDNPPNPMVLGDPTSLIPGTFTSTWGDLVIDPPGTYSIARLTFPQGVLPNVVNLGYYHCFAGQVTPDAQVFIPELGFSISWLPDADGSWHNPANWNTGQVPQFPDDVLIDVGGPVVRTITINQGTVTVARVLAEERVLVSGGTFSVLDDGEFRAGLTLSGGALGSGTYRGLPLAVAGSGGTIERAVLYDGMTVESGATATVINNVTIHGSSTLNSGGRIRFTRQFQTSAALSGTGTLRCNGGEITIDAPGSLTINGGVTISGSGGARIGGNTPGTSGIYSMSNNGRILADGSAGSMLQIVSDNFSNVGTLEARSGCTLLVDRGMTSTGQILARAGSEVVIKVLYMYAGTVGGDGAVRILNEYRVDGIVNKVGSGVLRINGNLYVFEGRTLDLFGGTLIHDYGSAYVPIRSLLINGYNGGSWDGSGITSSTAAADPTLAVGYAEASALFTSFPATFAGETIDNTTTLVRLVRYGDANLDGTVSLKDFNRLAGSFGQSGVWSDGDFNYDGFVNMADFNLLAGNFGMTAGPDGPTPQDWASLASVVPEPAAAGLLFAASVLLVRRR